MNVPSARAWVLTGFSLSLLSVVVNTFVLASINSKLKRADSEYARLNESLNEQAHEMSDADLQFDVFRILHNVKYGLPPERAEAARHDATALLRNYLVEDYGAVHDVPQAELNKAQAEEESSELAKAEKLKGLFEKLKRSADKVEQKQLLSEIGQLSQEKYQPRSELGKKLQEVEQYADTELNANSDADVEIGLLPIQKSFGETIAENFEKKENRMRELEVLRESLGRKSEYATYAAISLQLFGLMLVLAKDLFKDKKPKVQKADAT